MTALVHVIVMVGMLGVVPLGLRLIGGLPAWLPRLWLAGAVLGGVSLWLPRGGVAVALGTGYAVLTAVLAAQAPLRLARTRSLAAPEVAVLTALVAPLVAGVALVAERGDYELFGFERDILALTVAHFHFAGFAAALIAALVSGAAKTAAVARMTTARLADAAALTVPAGIALVFLGFFTGEWVEFAGALVLTAGMWTVAWATVRQVRPATSDTLTRALLAVSACVLAATMLLAVHWAAAEALDLPHPSLTWTAATHGVANALGFALCGLLAWRRLPMGTR